jgi:hypothetical protein
MLKYIVKLDWSNEFEFTEDYANTAIKFAEIAEVHRMGEPKHPEVTIIYTEDEIVNEEE